MGGWGGAGIGSLRGLMVTQRGTSAGKPSALLAEFYEVGGEENLGLQHREGGREGGRGVSSLNSCSSHLLRGGEECLKERKEKKREAVERERWRERL